MGMGYEPQSVCHTFWLGLTDTARYYRIEAREDVPPAKTSLLYVNKQIHQEA
jgi:hypothetical protein